MSYLLKLKDNPECRDGKFADKPLYFACFDGEGGFWEFFPSVAQKFDTATEAMQTAIRENAFNAFDPLDQLFIVNMESMTQTPIDLQQLKKASTEYLQQHRADRRQQRLQEQREERREAKMLVNPLHVNREELPEVQI
jgi:hypothetical protein